MALLEMINEKAFLGMEFATWLWYLSEGETRGIEIPKHGFCEIALEKDLLLSSEVGESQNSTFKGDAPTLAPEAATALLAGKKVKRAKIILELDGIKYELSLNAESFDWSGLKIDTPPSLPFEEAVPIRLNALEEFHKIFAALYNMFLDLRLDPEAWEAEEGKIREWVHGKTEGGNEDAE
ncbi:MAG: hypothetical protein ACLFUS_04430 [Candidatus Sumerlaeia bacterium]